MLGYEYDIIYIKGNDNFVADALSKQYEDEGSLLTLSDPNPNWLDESCQEWIQDLSTPQLISKLQYDPKPPIELLIDQEHPQL